MRTPVEPDGALGPGGTVYVMTSTVGVEPPAEGEPPAPDPETVTVFAGEGPPELEPGIVTVNGCGEGVAPPAPGSGTVTVRG